MGTNVTMLRPTQTTRQRELFRYFQPPSLPHQSSEKAGIFSSNDLSLTAFAQLGALRLNAKRGIISLVGRDIEYVIAEAGMTLSLQDGNRHDKGDELWYGVGGLQSKAAIGLVVIDILAGISQNAIPHLVVNDLCKDDRFSHLPLVIEEPFARFLACFPLQTPAGHVIGLYTIVHDQPRELSDSEREFLRDMARTAMNHIEKRRVKQQHHRAERMVKALGLFLEGGDSLRNWRINQGSEGHSVQQVSIKENVRRGLSNNQQADEEFGIQDLPDRYPGTFGLKTLEDMPHNAQAGPFRCAQSIPGDGRPTLPRSVSNSTGTGIGPYTALSSDFTLQMEQESVTSDGSSMSLGRTRYDVVPGAPRHSDILNQTLIPDQRPREPLSSSELKRIFARASNLIREAIDVCGVAFFDASIGSFGAASARTNMNANAPGALIVDCKVNTTPSSSEEEKRRSSDMYAVDEELSASPVEKYVGILGYSTRTRSSINKHSVSGALEPFPESLLRQLAKRYPRGKIFSFDDNGTTSSEEISHVDPQAYPRLDVSREGFESRRKAERLTIEEEAIGVLSVVPEARSVAWFPLWDSTLERWYAGTLIWSTSATRVFSPDEEIIYVATFGNSIMAEVSRLLALVASQMKVDFISSISHDLRTPLHGILACVEFLKDDQGNADMSADMVDTINNCGHTLLQTIDHVLDFTQITNKVKAKSSYSQTIKHPKGNVRTRRPTVSNGMPMDLRILTEEVIDSVYAGRRPREINVTTNSSDPFHHTVHPAPTIIVDVSWRENWTFDISDGAWRRILMNLFSNAVKYTKRGYVRIALDVKLDEVPGIRKPYPRLCLEVSDSEQGISQEYLKNHLYTAFKQEDALSVGTGLGLSIVRQIILDLGGKINIKSEVGIGTQAYVSIPLLPNTAKVSKGKDSVVEAQKNVAGLKACLVNSAFDLLPAMSDAPTGIMSPEAEALMLLKSSVRSILTDWFGMEVITSSKLDLTSANIHITTSSEIVDEEIHAAKFDSSGLGPVTVIVICSSLSRNPNFVTDSGIYILHLQQPVSPHKFAAVLSHIVHQTSISTQDANIALIKTHSSSIEISDDLRDINWSTSTIYIPSTFVEPILPTMIPGSFPTKHASYSAATIHPLKILLVEDNEINLSLLVKCISKLQHSFMTATNGREAVEAFQSKGPFDVVILDIQMPIMDRFAATREIRKIERKDRKHNKLDKREEVNEGLVKEDGATVIALTGASSAMAKQEAVAEGINLFLVKPVSMKAVRDVLAGLEGCERSVVVERG